uniref:Oxidoreductase-like domain-containing protein n=1 Tax=Bracon brevicornis TaxID=1563983 RepID=A0A6V7K2R3_9HYME
MKTMASLVKLRPMIMDTNTLAPILTKFQRKYSNNGDNEDDVKSKRPMVMEKDIEDDDGDLEEPTNCCMSGCANCVWVVYAEKMSKKLANSNCDVQKMILDKIQDPNMKAFLAMELRCRNIS